MRLSTCKIFTSVSVALFVFVLATNSYAQSRISGQVFGENRRPLADVHVELLNEVESVLARTKTDGVGTYNFVNLSSGRFSVRVRPFGTNYEEQTQEVEIVTFVGGRQVAENARRDFFMRLRKSADRLAAAPGVIFAQEVPPSAQQAYERGISHLNGGRVDPGVEELKAAVTIFPTYFLALDRLGVEFIKKQQWKEGSEYFARAVAVNDKSANSWYGLAFCSYATGAGDKAVEAAKRASSLSPDSPDIQLLLGITLRRLKQYTDAEKALLKAKGLFEGKSAEVFWHLALLYAHDLRKFSLAADALADYLKIQPSHPQAALLKKLIQQYREMRA